MATCTARTHSGLPRGAVGWSSATAYWARGGQGWSYVPSHSHEPEGVCSTWQQHLCCINPRPPTPVYRSGTDGEPVVALRPLCDALGIDYSNQLKKLRSRSWATVVLSTTVAGDGLVRQMAMIDRRTLTMRLAGSPKVRRGSGLFSVSAVTRCWCLGPTTPRVRMNPQTL